MANGAKSQLKQAQHAQDVQNRPARQPKTRKIPKLFFWIIATCVAYPPLVGILYSTDGFTSHAVKGLMMGDGVDSFVAVSLFCCEVFGLGSLWITKVFMETD